MQFLIEVKVNSLVLPSEAFPALQTPATFVFWRETRNDVGGKFELALEVDRRRSSQHQRVPEPPEYLDPFRDVTIVFDVISARFGAHDVFGVAVAPASGRKNAAFFEAAVRSEERRAAAAEEEENLRHSDQNHQRAEQRHCDGDDVQ